MQILVFILSLFVLYKTVIYGIFEIKENNNKTAGIFIIVIAVVCIIYPNIMVYIM